VGDREQIYPFVKAWPRLVGNEPLLVSACAPEVVKSHIGACSPYWEHCILFKGRNVSTILLRVFDLEGNAHQQVANSRQIMLGRQFLSFGCQRVEIVVRVALGLNSKFGNILLVGRVNA
jgi:hypothetical protein